MNRATYRILLLESDPAERRALSGLFAKSGFRVLSADRCDAGIVRARRHRPDVCILNLELPDSDGVNFIRSVRAWSPVAIIALTGSSSEVRRLEAFDAGADDCLMKSASSAELLARVWAIIRRLARLERPTASLRIGNCLVDLGRRLISNESGAQVHLTSIEHRILECLARNADKIVTHEQVVREVWGPDHDNTRSLRVYIVRLRHKLEVDPAQPRHIVTQTGVGYRLVTNSDSNTVPHRPSVRSVPI